MIAEKEEVDIRYQIHQLKKVCKNCSEAELAKLDEAINYARQKFGAQRRESGELQILHGLAVALIVSSEIGLKSGSVMAALLHDIINTSFENPDELQKKFGNDVAAIIRGFKKISSLHSNLINFQSQNFRSLFLSLIDDVRIIFIKMAHRLYDMRNFQKLPDDLKMRYLGDVQYLYIPIAHRMGLYQVKAELEDLAMKYTDTERYQMISMKIEDSREQQSEYIRRFVNPIKAKLQQEKINFDIKSRAKSIPSISTKMEAQGVSFEQVYDLFAIRVILNVLTDQENEFIENYKKRLETGSDLRPDKKAKKFLDKDISDVTEGKKQKEAAESEYNFNTEEALKLELKAKFENEPSLYNELLNREKTACWQAYSIITNIYQPNPKRLRDWISAPKASGYESLHTTVLGPDNRWVEVQIRTNRMDEVAEKGDAAHWRYKESAYGKNIDQWMYDVRNVLETIGAQRLEEGKTSKISTKSDNIYVLTPDGDLRELKAGSTVLDFAFDIHSELGSKCIGAKIGGKVCPIRHQLSNGDRVEIITSKTQKPNIDWLNFVVTSKAKSRINRALREDKYKDAEAGKEILTRKLKNWKIEFSDHNIARIVKYYNFQKPVDLFYNIAIGKLDVLEIKQLFTLPEEVEEKSDAFFREGEPTEEFIESQSMKDQGYILIEAGVSNLNYSLAKCCNPLAGEPVFGFVTVLHGIKIHRVDCPNAPAMKSKYPYRIIKAKWKTTKNTRFYVTNLRVLGLDRVGLLNDITKVISDDLKTNMLNLNFKTHGSNFEGVIKVQVRDVDHLGFLKKKLQAIKGISKVIRFD